MEAIEHDFLPKQKKRKQNSRVRRSWIVKKHRHEWNSDRLITPDGIRFICKSYNFDAEKIGQHFIKLLPKIYFFKEKNRLERV